MKKLKFEKFKFILLLSITFMACANMVTLFNNPYLQIFGSVLTMILGALTVGLIVWTLSKKADYLFSSD